MLGTAFQAGSVGAPCVIPQLLEPLRDFGAVLGDENLFWQFLVEPPNEGPIDHPSPQIPSQDRPNDYMRVHRIASLALDIDASQAAALSEAFACGDRANGWTRTPTSSPQGPMGVSGCDQNGGQVVPGRHFVLLAAMADDLPMATSDWHSFVMALDADGDASNNYMATPGFENDPYAGTDRFYELNHTPGQGWRMVGVDARNTQPVEIPTGGRAIVDRNLILMLVPAAESAVANPGVRFVGFRHQGQFGLTGNPWAMDVQPRRPGFVPTVSIPPLTTPGG
ncbi:MAG: hypothetical protein HKO98_07075 [Gemmatimonadetes bacterium]|nr:hypothetical protein [Gemmatimonadota bacterium]